MPFSITTGGGKPAGAGPAGLGNSVDTGAQWEEFDPMAEAAEMDGARPSEPSGAVAGYDKTGGQWEEFDPVAEAARMNGMPLPVPVLRDAMGTNPEEAAEASRLAARTGMPFDMVQRNLSDVRQQARMDDVTGMLVGDDLRGTAQLLADPRRAGMAHDDVDNLAGLEMSMRGAAQMFAVAVAHPRAAFGRFLYSPSYEGTPGALKNVRKTVAMLPPKTVQFGGQALRFLGGALTPMTEEELTAVEASAPWDTTFTKPLNASHDMVMRAVSGTLDDAGAYLSRIGGDALKNPDYDLQLPKELQGKLWDNIGLLMDAEYMTYQVGDAVTSMVPAIAAAVATGGGSLAPSVVAALQEAGGLYEDLLGKGASTQDALAASAAFGVVTGVLNKIGFDKLLQKLPTEKVLANLAHRIGAGGTEAVTEYLEEPFQAAFAGIAQHKSMDAIIADVLDSLKNIDVMPGAFLLGASGAVSKAVNQVDEKEMEHAGSVARAEVMREIAKQVDKSQYRGRDPQGFAEHVETLTPQEMTEQWVNAEQLETLFQSAPEAGAEMDLAGALETLGVAPEAFARARRDGGAVPVRTARALAALPSQMRDALIPHMKATPLSPSEAEAMAFDAESEARRLYDQYAPDEEREEAYRMEEARLVAQLMTTGRMDEQTARTSLAVPMAFARVLERSYGRDGVEFLQRVQIGEEAGEGALFQAAMYRSPKTSVAEFARGVWEGKQERPAYFGAGPAPEALTQALRDNLGLRFENVDIRLSDAQARHIKSRHPKTTPEDVESLLGVLNDFDGVQLSYPKEYSYNGLSFIAYRVRDGIAEAVTGEYASAGKQMVVYVSSMYRGTEERLQQTLDAGAGKDGKSARKRLARIKKEEDARLGSNNTLDQLRYQPEGSHATQDSASSSDSNIASDEAGGKGSEGGETYYQKAGEVARGSLSRLPGGNYAVQLFEKADLSTFLHEAGHIFLTELERIAAAPDAPAQLVHDVEVIREWLKAEDGTVLSREQHEQWARGFEAYLREGKAPSMELGAAFHRFRTWLTNLYKSIRNLDVTLSAEVRGVMDRMLATDEQIAEARHINEMVAMEKARLLDMVADENDLAELGRLQEEAEREATVAMDRATLRDRRGRERRALQLAKDIVDQETVYKALRYLTGKESSGLDAAYVLETFGEGTYRDLKAKTRNLLRPKGGLHADVVATELGYEDGDRLIYAILDAPTRKERIAAVAQEVMQREDMQVDAVETVMAGEAYGKYLERFNALLAKKIRSKTYSPREWLRRIAKESVGDTIVREAVRYDIHQNTMRKQARLRDEAARRGDWNAEAFHLEKVRLAHEVIGESIRAREEVREIEARVKRLAKKKSLDSHYRDQLRALAVRYGMVGASLAPRNPDTMTNLESVLAGEKDLMGLDASFPGWLVMGHDAMDYRDLSMAQLRAVNDLISFLAHRGGELRKESKAIAKERVEQAVASCVAAGRDLPARKVLPKDSVLRKLSELKDGFIAQLDTLKNLLSAFDGYDDIGPDGTRGANVRTLFDPLVDAQNNETLMWAEIKDKLAAPLGKLRKSAREWERKFGARMNVPGIYVPQAMRADGRTWTADSVLGLALNMGTLSNIERLYAGFPDLKQHRGSVEGLLDLLSMEDWQAVQKIWDTIEDYYPQIDEVHYRLNGFRMKKIEARPVTIERGGKFLKLRGGYFPAVYDGGLIGSQFVRQYTELDELMNRAEAMHQTPATRSGFTQDRKATAPGFPLKLSLSVAVSHLAETAHYITHAEALRFADKVTRHKEWETNFKGVMGNAAYDAVRGHLKAIARPDTGPADVNQKIAEALRRYATPFILAWNVGVGMKQVFSMPGGVHDIGVKDCAKALKTLCTQSPLKKLEWIHSISPYMASRSTSMDRELTDMAKRFALNRRTVEMFGKEISADDVADFGFWPIRLADTMACYPLWVAAYEKHMRATGGDMDASVLYADDIIRKSQPSSQAIDQTMWQRHRGALRWFSMFQTFTVRTFGARVRHHYRAMRAGKLSKGEYLRYVIYDQILPPIAMHLAFALMWHDAPDPDDDEAMAAFLLDMGKSVAGYQMSGIPLVSTIFSPFGAMDTPAATGPELVQKALTDGWNFFTDYDEGAAEKAMWSLYALGSYVTRVPASQLTRKAVKGWEQYEEGEGGLMNILVPEPKK